MPRENSIQSSVLEWLSQQDDCIAENVWGGPGMKGRPDINACFRGQLIRIELKTPDHGNQASPHQEKNLRMWAKKAGAICITAFSLADVQYLFMKHVGLRCTYGRTCLGCKLRKKGQCYRWNEVDEDNCYVEEL